MRARSRATPSSVMTPLSLTDHSPLRLRVLASEDAAPRRVLTPKPNRLGPEYDHRMSETTDLPRTIPGILDRAAEKFGAAEALVDGELRLSWIEMVEEIDRAAAALIATGVEPG